MKYLWVFSISIAALACKNNATYSTVDANSFEQKLKTEKNYTVLDVRTPEEFAAGHLENAINIDVNGDEFEKKVGELEKSKTYFVYCKAGKRSLKACDAMTQSGFKNLVNLECGFDCWSAENKPVKK